ncbi:MAG: hypothetical protein HN745_03500 [Deltaproteobacteria bacterium]|nr:hypothetical protein [Deltaproteobacteria bacterium]
MKFYQLPQNLPAEINLLEAAIADFRKGQIHPIKFRALRVPFGIYEQREQNTFMIRIRATAGGATPEQLIRVASLAKEYGKPIIHLTTRQEMQLHDIKLDDAPLIMRELVKVGLSCRGGGGNTIRNVMASFDSGINPFEVFDVTPHAIALSSHLLSDSDSWNLPRKFKICFSNSAQDHTLAVFNDLGFIARLKHGKRGFQVWVAGGMGCRPRLGRLLHDFIHEDKVLHVYLAIKQLFYAHGNRKNKNSNRLRFLWDELGEDRFLEIYRCEFDQVESGSELSLKLEEVENGRNVKNLTPIPVSGNSFETWKGRFVSAQKQPGLKSIQIPFNRGDISADDAITLGRLLTSFGSNVLRFTTRQNIQLRNIPQEFLGHIFKTVLQLDTLSASPGIVGNLISCKGAKTCTAGICFSQDAAQAIQQKLTHSGSELELPDELNINISGCPNSCGQHHAADLGFSGKVARKNGRTFPAYWVYGGASPNSTAPRFAEKTSWVPAKALPSAIQDILEKYNTQKTGYPHFAEYFINGGQKDIFNICEKYQREMPTFTENSDYYTDWGTRTPFTTVHLGHGECSAGVYDMIEVEMEAIQLNQQKASALKTGDELQATLWDIVYSAANMLLITRGVDPGTEDEVFGEYFNHFFDTNLISESYKGIVIAAQGKNLTLLEQQKERVYELGDIMIQLYHKMDNSMRFPGEHESNSAAAAENLAAVPLATKDNQIDKTRDLRGVACPMNFVKTKVELAGMSSAQVLEILLDDGEPIDNVPRSVISEGHTILSQEKTDDYWTVVIKKV